MPIMIHGGGGGAEVQFAPITSDMLSLNGEYLLFTFPASVPVSNVVAFTAYLRFSDTKCDCHFSYLSKNNCIAFVGKNRTTDTTFTAVKAAVIDEGSNAIRIATGGWDERWSGEQSDILLNRGEVENCFYCYL